MVVSSFLAKHLLLDWRIGEKWFSQNQIDLDFSSNNGGWQWSASTGLFEYCLSIGTDSQPYFRVFSPTRQAERFDKEATFIKRWVPELRGVKAKYAIEPMKLGLETLKKLGYYEPIVEHVMARKRAIEAFKNNSDRDKDEVKITKKVKY
jgi:deoxyribodipyrimidine photo-lyase